MRRCTRHEAAARQRLKWTEGEAAVTCWATVPPAARVGADPDEHRSCDSHADVAGCPLLPSTGQTDTTCTLTPATQSLHNTRIYISLQQNYRFC